MQELQECTQNDPIQGMQVRLVDEADLYKWEINVEGPEKTPYEGGRYKLLLALPTEYPFKPPMISFQTKIYHMNVSNDEKGSMCLGMLRSDNWKPPNKIHAVLEMVKNLLYEPNPDDAVEPAIADQYKNNREEYDKTIREWVKKYAQSK
ncbi:MAG: hypothetical protein Q9162_003753 [Coniocarpon cinnabarinum]